MTRYTYEDFRHEVAKYRTTDILSLISAQDSKLLLFEMDESWAENPPWALAAIARDSIAFGSAGTTPASKEDLLRLVALFNASSEQHPLDVSNDTIMSSFLYEQLSYQGFLKRDIARGLILMQDMPEDPTNTFIPDWKEIWGYELDQVFSAVMTFCVAAKCGFGMISRSLPEEPQRQWTDQIVPVGLLRRTLARLTTTIPEAKISFDNSPIVESHLNRNQYNPLVTYPVIDMGSKNLVVPIPTFLLRSISLESLYYSGLNKWGKPFADQMGYRVETYVGRLMEGNPGVQAIREFPYKVGKKTLDSIDWFLLTDDVVALVESKSGLMPYPSRAGDQKSRIKKLSGIVGHAIDQINESASQLAEGNDYFESIPKHKPTLGIVVTMEPLHLINSPTSRAHLPVPQIPTISASLGEFELLLALSSEEINKCLMALHSSERLRSLPLMNAVLEILDRERLTDHPMIIEKYWESLEPTMLANEVQKCMVKAIKLANDW